MQTVEIVLFSIMIILYVSVGFILFRNNKVAQFRMNIIEEDYEEAIRRVNAGDFSNPSFNQYERLPSYEKMLYSFKPLKKKYWL